MKKSKLDTPHIKTQVVKQLAAGESQNSIANQVGLNQSSVCRFANREEIRAMIEEEVKRLVEVAPNAVQNLKNLVTEMPDIPKNDIKRRELSYKASKDVLKSLGILPSPVQSQTLVNLYQDNSINIDNPILQLILNDDTDTELPEDIELIGGIYSDVPPSDEEI